jgi:hypothetical protein
MGVFPQNVTEVHMKETGTDLARSSLACEDRFRRARAGWSRRLEVPTKDGLGHRVRLKMLGPDRIT